MNTSQCMLATWVSSMWVSWAPALLLVGVHFLLDPSYHTTQAKNLKPRTCPRSDVNARCKTRIFMAIAVVEKLHWVSWYFDKTHSVVYRKTFFFFSFFSDGLAQNWSNWDLLKDGMESIYGLSWAPRYNPEVNGTAAAILIDETMKCARLPTSSGCLSFWLELIPIYVMYCSLTLDCMAQETSVGASFARLSLLPSLGCSSTLWWPLFV